MLSRLAIGAARQFVNLANTLIPGKRQAQVVLVANSRTREALPAGLSGNVIELVENGIDFSIWKNSADPIDAAETAQRFVFIGRLVDWKAVDIAIRALAQVPSAELEIIGDGPMAAAWKSLAEELGIGSRVHFAGWLPQWECAARLRCCVALVLPSVYECGGAVVLEAMAMSKPVIATNWGGPADYLNCSCGFLIEPSSHEALIAGFAQAMQTLIDSPQQGQSMGSAGRERAIRHFDWQRKIEQMIEIYEGLLVKKDVAGVLQ